MKSPASPIVNAFSIDVEDWFQVAAFAPYIDRKDWDSLECRVERNVDLLLQTLDKHGVKATFFTLGWIAQRYPALVKRIVAGGHELASHGYGHHMIHELGEQLFREDVVRAKGLLEDLSGKPVIGYRAPSFSVGRDTLWALDVLAQTGHQYSSSIYPIKHDLYGMPEAPRFAHQRSGLLEIPATSIRLRTRNFPASGGGYFRLLPYSVSRWSLKRVNQVDGEAAVFYCHPWEIDPGQPKMHHASTKSRFRHYVNQGRMLGKIDRLLGDFAWGTVAEVIATPASIRMGKVARQSIGIAPHAASAS
jgi:polysaccharide deacetylase family protein (PEP-CTERM system associated)